MAKTRSPVRASPPDDYYTEADSLGISPEVAYYLWTREIPLPDCPPEIQTPNPGEADGALFDVARVDKVLKCFENLRHTQGRWAGTPLVPDPWQVAYIIAPVFGWVRWDDEAGRHVRVVNTLYAEVPRKNGKSTLCGGLAIYLACADGEPGAQVITAATSEKQASFVFTPIKQLSERSPALKPYVVPLQKRVVHSASGSYIEVISSVADAQHGANLHGAIVDELHVHKTPDLVETIETGTGSRDQPLIVIITTADTGKPDTIYSRKRRRIEQLANRALSDPTVYGVIWCADMDDDPFAEKTWAKANPGYGTSPTKAYLRRAASEAKDSPADLAKFLRLHLGIRTRQLTRFLTLEDWDCNAGMINRSALAGRLAYGGLDLGSTSDLTSFCLLFPDDAGGYDAVWRFWAPEDQLKSLDKRTANAASVWVKAGWLTLTDGNVTDYEVVRESIEEDLASYEVEEIAYDPWNSTDLINRLTAKNAPMVQVRQGYASQSPAMKEIKRLLKQGTEEAPRLRHGGNPVMRWMIDNLAVSMDAAGNVKPDKAKAADKIDGVSALSNAVCRLLAATPEELPEADIF